MSATRRHELTAEKLLRRQPLFRELDPPTVARLAAAAGRRLLRRGEPLFRQGDRPSGMYIVVYGRLKLLATDARGERLTGVVGPGRSFGEPVMFLQRPALVDAVAAEDALVLHLPSEAVFAEIDANPLLARRLLAALSQRVESLVHELGRQAAGGGRARLASYLLGLRGAADQDVVQLPAAKAAVATHLNLTAEHFSRLLREFAAEGAVSVQGRSVRLLAPQRLAEAAASGFRRRPAQAGARALRSPAPAP
ncbi:MAG TPA: Crp/Fnr family transcriptional regulator [Ramlibacter sp.]|uniref:Crp/Fnr family transcriptional regulator n=1 Tax=Ramlibacter sp. TaxID=1917967 RepID=UPI002D7F667E|nr:Crp/Fnr family transcriptional regulator [Ramlibacter sp.]HET8748617.1 Crp/Fnr family transcriptional regulator [Ramlibacter sp.]